MYFLYVLQSTKNHRYYIGSSANPDKRLREHNYGSTRSTKPYRPWKLIYKELHKSKSGASKREWYLKHPPGYLEKREIVEKYGNNGGFA